MDRQPDQNESLVSWMIAGGARLDQPEARHVSHLVALRDAARDADHVSPFARLTAWFGAGPRVAGVAVASSDVTACCSPA